MNLHATTRDEILNSIDDPIHREIKRIDLYSKNRKIFHDVVLLCLEYKYPDSEESMIAKWFDNECGNNYYLFCIKFLHRFKLITLREYYEDILLFINTD